MSNPATLRVEHLSKRYGAGTTEVVAVRDVSFEVAPGEIVLFMGPSGSGKTTLLSMLGALLRPTSGSIWLAGLDLANIPETQLPAIRLAKFGFVFQDFNLISALSALDNVALVAELAGASRSDARAKARTLLEMFGLGERLAFLPEDLSGGEKQRIAIARALINDPAMILADEPTANLDSKNGHDLMKLLRRIAQEQSRSVVIVSHDQRIRDSADRVLWLEDGELKQLAAMATDPVCGMPVERNQYLSTEWAGETRFFCAQGCQDEFLRDPEKFLR